MSETRLIKIVRTDYVEEKFIETINTSINGTYAKKDGVHYLFCGSFDENEDDKAKHRITIYPGKILLKTTGALSYTMVFREGALEKLEYFTPYGQISANIYTKYIGIEENNGRTSIIINFHTLMDEKDEPGIENESRICINIC